MLINRKFRVYLLQFYEQILYLWSLIVFGFAVSINPENTAVTSGTPVSYLNCSFASSTASQVIWSFQKNGTFVPILIGCNPSSSPYPQYGAENTTSDSCNLIIYNASASLAGVYQCASTGLPLPLYAQFIVLGSDPVCSTTPMDQIPVDQSVDLSCGTTVSGNLWPVMTWSNSTQQLPSPQINSSSFVGSKITVQAQIPTVPSYTCSTKFTAPVNVPDGYATNAPTYTSQCNTASLQVLYPPSAGSMNIELNGNPNNVSCQDTLSCCAQAFPPPIYTWTLPDGSTATGSTLSVTQAGTDLLYMCTAKNTQGSASVSIMLNVSYCPSTTIIATSVTKTTVPASETTTVVTVAGDSTNVGAIVGAVIGCLAAISLIALVAICCCVKSCPLYQKCRADKSAAKTSSGIENGATTVTDLSDLSACKPEPIYEDVESNNDYMKLNFGNPFYENGQMHIYAPLTVDARSNASPAISQ